MKFQQHSYLKITIAPYDVPKRMGKPNPPMKLIGKNRLLKEGG